jgi:hypothetical protein
VLDHPRRGRQEATCRPPIHPVVHLTCRFLLLPDADLHLFSLLNIMVLSDACREQGTEVL